MQRQTTESDLHLWEFDPPINKHMSVVSHPVILYIGSEDWSDVMFCYKGEHKKQESIPSQMPKNVSKIADYTSWGKLIEVESDPRLYMIENPVGVIIGSKDTRKVTNPIDEPEDFYVGSMLDENNKTIHLVVSSQKELFGSECDPPKLFVRGKKEGGKYIVIVSKDKSCVIDKPLEVEKKPKEPKGAVSEAAANTKQEKVSDP